MPYGFSSVKIEKAIRKREKECAEMVERHIRPEFIEKHREVLPVLYGWLEEAKKCENGQGRDIRAD